MRRCLRVFLVGLITLSLLSGPAHACWRSRQARHCRPVMVVACPAPAWSECCDPCGEPVVVVAAPCLPAAACCGEAVVSGEAAIAADETIIVSDVAGSVIESQPKAVIAQPTPATEEAAPRAVAESKPVELERVPSQPPAEAGGVRPTSNEQPLAEPVTPAAEAPDSRSVLADEPDMKEVAGEPAAATPAEPADPAPAAEEPAAAAGDEPEMKEDEPTLPGDAAPAAEPAAPVAENPVEPPMEEDVAEPKPEPEPAPADEPDPLEPEPAPKTEPEPKPAPVEEKEDNIFEELDATGAAPAEDAAPSSDPAPAGTEEEMADEPDATVRDLFDQADQADAAPAKPAAEPAAEPASEPAEPADPAADLFGDGDAADPAAETEMTEGEPAADDGGSEPADPFADSAPTPADDASPAAEPATPAPTADPADDPAPADDSAAPSADPFARGEPKRRWIDATGTASMVATLIEVAADGRCVLETSGGRIAVPVENLSSHDRDYVRQAGVRLAKLRADKAGETAAAAPAPTDTAGL